MKRFARVASCAVIGFLALAARAQAQTPPVEPSRFYAGITFGATLGHKSSGSIGAEVGGQVSGPVWVFFEGGHMGNVGTSDLDARAQKIANFVGATASASYKVNYFDVGVRVTPDLALPYHPYVAVGIGAAHVTAETALAVNGTTVPPENLGVQFGSDLNGSVTKPFFVIGGGVAYPFKQRYVADVSYRYGRIFPKTSEIENDQGINTQRVQVTVGVRF